MTLGELIEERGSSMLLDGLTLVLPDKYVGGHMGVPQKEMKLRSAWGMGDGKVGIWFQLPETYPTGQTWPVTNLDFKNEVETWEVKLD